MLEKKQVIKNRVQILKGEFQELRKDACQIIEKGVLKAVPEYAVYDSVHLDGNMLVIDGATFDLTEIENIYVVGAGKASVPILQALDNILGDRIQAGFAAVKDDHPPQLSRIKLFTSSHPTPDERSIIAAKHIAEILLKAGHKDLILAAITGGASSLLLLPPEGITLAEIQKLNDDLLKSGGSIVEINTVRRHLCGLKGGNVVKMAQPAKIITFSLNTGTQGLPWPDMCLTDSTSYDDAIQVMKRYDLWETAPDSIREFFMEGARTGTGETVKNFDGMQHKLVYLADPSIACQEMAREASILGYNSHVLAVSLDGEAKDVGIVLASIANEIINNNHPFSAPCALISGGETTVTFYGDGPFGNGGPNQETALGFAIQLGQGYPAVCLSIDSDGTDGPSTIAGGISDGQTKQRVEQEGQSIKDCLRKHDSSTLFQMLEDNVITGHTGTNIMNLRVVLIGQNRGD